MKFFKKIKKFLKIRYFIVLMIIFLLLCLFGYLFLAAHNPFPVKIDENRTKTYPDWWENPKPLTEEEIKFQNWIKSVTYQLPEEKWTEVWSVGGRQTGIYSIRYQAAFTAYASSLLGMRTPAYPGLPQKILDRILKMLIHKKTWGYVKYYWKDKPLYPDPCAYENIMYTGHLFQILALYEVLTGDDKYRTEGFDFIWDEKTSFHYDTMKVVDGIVKQMRENESGGVACEPGLVFFPCNNHPHIALKLLEGLKLGNWEKERQKWEKWAMSSYYATLGGGAFKLLYHQKTKMFAARGLPGLDGWSLMWYHPWASDENNCEKIWKIARNHIGLKKYEKNEIKDSSGKNDNCCNPVMVAPAAVASFLLPAARVCKDPETAEILEKWLDDNFLKDDGKKCWLNTQKQWQFGCTANRISSLAVKNGSSFRNLVQNPLPKEYFQKPYIKEITPDSVDVYQAYRKDNSIILEVDGEHKDIEIKLANLAKIKNIDGLNKSQWNYQNNILTIKNPERKIIRIQY